MYVQIKQRLKIHPKACHILGTESIIQPNAGLSVLKDGIRCTYSVFRMESVISTPLVSGFNRNVSNHCQSTPSDGSHVRDPADWFLPGCHPRKYTGKRTPPSLSGERKMMPMYRIERLHVHLSATIYFLNSQSHNFNFHVRCLTFYATEYRYDARTPE